MTLLSVIIPTFKGAKRVVRALESVRLQSTPTEAICIVNGPEDGTLEVVTEYAEANPDFEIKIVRFHGEGAGAARNIGLDVVSGEYITMLDDDDALGLDFSSALDLRGGQEIVCTPIVDVNEHFERLTTSSLQIRLESLAGKRVTAHEAPWLLGYNAAKIIPRSLLRDVRYSEALQSGEDVEFFARLILEKAPETTFYIAPRSENLVDQAYLRTIRPGSRSRLDSSFDFDVNERFDVVTGLERLEVKAPERPILTSLVRSQLSFVQSFVKANPELSGNVIGAGLERGVAASAWQEINRDDVVDSLVVSYCFPPDNDPSGIVTAKRIIENGKVVDVISADMSSVRESDDSLLRMVSPFLRKHHRLDGPVSFSDWNVISDFAQRAYRIWRGKQNCNEIYTRALWSASHVAGALITSSDPSVRWIAEFSDPMRLDSQLKARLGSITQNRTTRVLRRAVKKSGMSKISLNSHFELTEAATIVLASELVFTNTNQLDTVTLGYPQDWVELIRSKAKICPQPTLDRRFYSLGSAITKPDGEINIGYFGSFYPNRGLGRIISRVEAASPETRTKFNFVVFTPNPSEAASELEAAAPNVSFQCHGYLKFLDFLATLDALDVLLVVDTEVQTESANPFLPSKYSDYAGSERAIWAVVDDDSPLSTMSTAFKSNLSDVATIDRVISDLAGMGT